MEIENDDYLSIVKNIPDEDLNENILETNKYSTLYKAPNEEIMKYNKYLQWLKKYQNTEYYDYINILNILINNYVEDADYYKLIPYQVFENLFEFYNDNNFMVTEDYYYLKKFMNEIKFEDIHNIIDNRIQLADSVANYLLKKENALFKIINENYDKNKILDIYGNYLTKRTKKELNNKDSGSIIDIYDINYIYLTYLYNNFSYLNNIIYLLNKHDKDFYKELKKNKNKKNNILNILKRLLKDEKYDVITNNFNIIDTIQINTIINNDIPDKKYLMFNIDLLLNAFNLDSILSYKNIQFSNCNEIMMIYYINFNIHDVNEEIFLKNECNLEIFENIYNQLYSPTNIFKDFDKLLNKYNSLEDYLKFDYVSIDDSVNKMIVELIENEIKNLLNNLSDTEKLKIYYFFENAKKIIEQCVEYLHRYDDVVGKAQGSAIREMVLRYKNEINLEDIYKYKKNVDKYYNNLIYRFEVDNYKEDIGFLNKIDFYDFYDTVEKKIKESINYNTLKDISASFFKQIKDSISSYLYNNIAGENKYINLKNNYWMVGKLLLDNKYINIHNEFSFSRNIDDLGELQIERDNFFFKNYILEYNSYSQSTLYVHDKIFYGMYNLSYLVIKNKKINPLIKINKMYYYCFYVNDYSNSEYNIIESEIFNIVPIFDFNIIPYFFKSQNDEIFDKMGNFTINTKLKQKFYNYSYFMKDLILYDNFHIEIQLIHYNNDKFRLKIINDGFFIPDCYLYFNNYKMKLSRMLPSYYTFVDIETKHIIKNNIITLFHSKQDLFITKFYNNTKNVYSNEILVDFLYMNKLVKVSIKKKIDCELFLFPLPGSKYWFIPQEINTENQIIYFEIFYNFYTISENNNNLQILLLIVDKGKIDVEYCDYPTPLNMKNIISFAPIIKSPGSTVNGIKIVKLENFSGTIKIDNNIIIDHSFITSGDISIVKNNNKYSVDFIFDDDIKAEIKKFKDIGIHDNTFANIDCKNSNIKLKDKDIYVNNKLTNFIVSNDAKLYVSNKKIEEITNNIYVVYFSDNNISNKNGKVFLALYSKDDLKYNIDIIYNVKGIIYYKNIMLHRNAILSFNFTECNIKNFTVKIYNTEIILTVNKLDWIYQSYQINNCFSQLKLVTESNYSIFYGIDNLFLIKRDDSNRFFIYNLICDHTSTFNTIFFKDDNNIIFPFHFIYSNNIYNFEFKNNTNLNKRNEILNEKINLKIKYKNEDIRNVSVKYLYNPQSEIVSLLKDEDKKLDIADDKDDINIIDTNKKNDSKEEVAGEKISNEGLGNIQPGSTPVKSTNYNIKDISLPQIECDDYLEYQEYKLPNYIFDKINELNSFEEKIYMVFFKLEFHNKNSSYIEFPVLIINNTKKDLNNPVIQILIENVVKTLKYNIVLKSKEAMIFKVHFFCEFPKKDMSSAIYHFKLFDGDMNEEYIGRISHNNIFFEDVCVGDKNYDELIFNLFYNKISLIASKYDKIRVIIDYKYLEKKKIKINSPTKILELLNIFDKRQSIFNREYNINYKNCKNIINVVTIQSSGDKSYTVYLFITPFKIIDPIDEEKYDKNELIDRVYKYCALNFELPENISNILSSDLARSILEIIDNIQNSNISNNKNIIKKAIELKKPTINENEFNEIIKSLTRIYENKSILLDDYGLIEDYFKDNIKENEFKLIQIIFTILFDIIEDIHSYSKMLFSKSVLGGIYPQNVYNDILKTMKESPELKYLINIDSINIVPLVYLPVKEIKEYENEKDFTEIKTFLVRCENVKDRFSQKYGIEFEDN